MRVAATLLLFPALAAACGFGFDAWFDGRCFKSWNYGQAFHSNAAQQCELSNAHLPIIRSAEENKLLYDMARRETQGVGPSTPIMFWIGLECNGAEFVWPDGSVAQYTNFDSDGVLCTPDTKGRLFFLISDDYTWSPSGNVLFGIEYIVCEAKYRSESKCDDFEEVPGSEDDCYVLRSGATSAYSAERSCGGLGTHVTSVHSKNMNDFMRRTAIANGFLNGMHIGMAQRDYVHFTWLDHSPLDYDNFAPGQPNESQGQCVKMTTDSVEGNWTAQDCLNANLPFMCGKKALILNDAPQPAGCPQNVQYKAGDHIYSPSFPTEGGAALCNYRIGEADINKKVQLDFVFFESNRCCDALLIFDTDGAELMTLSGFKGATSLSVRAKGNTMTLRWNATSGAHVRGFHAIASNY